MHSLDVGTLLLVYEVLAAMVMVFVLAGAWHARNLDPLWIWAGGFAAVWMSQMIRYPVVAQWGYRASLPVGHIGGLLHAALLAIGVRSFLRMRPRYRLVALPLALASAFSLASVYLLQMRPGWSLSVTQIAAGLLLAVAAVDSARGYRRSRHVTLRIMALVLGVSALVAVARGGSVLARLLVPAAASVASVESANAPWLLATLGLLVAQGFAILLLVSGALQREVQALADLDPLTGLLNRRGLDTRVEQLMHGTPRSGAEQVLAVAVIDLDHFKTVNDRFGHAVGDRVLVGVAERLQSIIRPQDLVARLGGEEFVLILQIVVPHTLAPLTERVRGAVAGAPVETEAGPIPVTVSMGVATMRAADSLADAMRSADQALYRAKRGGRNRIELAESAQPG